MALSAIYPGLEKLALAPSPNVHPHPQNIRYVPIPMIRTIYKIAISQDDSYNILQALNKLNC